MTDIKLPHKFNSAKQTDTSSAMVSVIVPIYNAAPYLDQALFSVQDQTHVNLEIICLNDGSTDNSLEIMKEHATADSRIVVIDKPNEGYGATCNRGFDAAHGNWIAILEPDDWIEPTMFKDMLEFANSFTSIKQIIDVIKTPYWSIINADTPHERKIACRYKGRIKPLRQPFTLQDATRLIRHRPSIWSALYRTDFIRSHNIRFVEAPGAGWADNPFLYETLCRANGIAYLDTPYYCYREESPDKTALFARNTPFVAFDRWNEMTDILEQLDIIDPDIWGAHCKRGLNYIRLVTDIIGFDNDRVKTAVVSMLKRMPEKTVYAEAEISPHNKRFYAQLLDLPEPSISSISYTKTLIAEGIASLRNAGLRETIRQMKSVSS
ncbi:glycosyltransferase [Adlercreutzia sp. ZJ138]|uniref:glycosyltransferase n=1 Tax=Adlercreutzia sp. ZJ138 TaxID=2709405 RepID=UPI0013ECC82E|nr:glycosyltransferase [Adlercreutzia sp. ZJ138]